MNRRQYKAWWRQEGRPLLSDLMKLIGISTKEIFALVICFAFLVGLLWLPTLLDYHLNR